jgi:putative phosphoribosyl transferase
MFQDREDAARQLAVRLKGRNLRKPLILAIPRGGVAVGTVLAQELDAELNVILVQKVLARVGGKAIGALDEDGRFHLNPMIKDLPERLEPTVGELHRGPLAELVHQQHLYRSVLPATRMVDRSVIVVDDGIATGSTMFAALRYVQAHDPFEVIAAVPVAPPQQLDELLPWCDDVVWLLSPEEFEAVDEFYEGLVPLADAKALELLSEAATAGY